MEEFDAVITQLCKARRCYVISHKGNILELHSDSLTFYEDLAYFQAACDCYMAALPGSTAWIIGFNKEDLTIKLGYNY